MQIYFDDARIGCDGQLVQARIAWRYFAFDDDGQAKILGGGFNARDEVEIILGGRHGRHENMETSMARFNAEGGADNPWRTFLLARAAGRVVVRGQGRPFDWKGSRPVELLRSESRAMTGRHRFGAATEKMLAGLFPLGTKRKLVW